MQASCLPFLSQAPISRHRQELSGSDVQTLSGQTVATDLITAVTGGEENISVMVVLSHRSSGV